MNAAEDEFRDALYAKGGKLRSAPGGEACVVGCFLEWTQTAEYNSNVCI